MAEGRSIDDQESCCYEQGIITSDKRDTVENIPALLWRHSDPQAVCIRSINFGAGSSSSSSSRRCTYYNDRW